MANETERHRLGVLEHGTLEDISKPPSSRNRAGSRVTSSQLSNASASSTTSRLRLQAAASLELLTPEEVMEQDFDLELEDYGGSSDETTDDEDVGTGRTSEIFHIAEPFRQPSEVYMSEDSTLNEDDDKQLAIYGSLLGDEETLVDSDEENLIMKEIRAEITAQIRGEMKSELEMYKKKREALTSAIDDPEKDKDEDEEDPKLKEAIIKMKKLDKILSRKVKREKEVKRDRILLQRKLHKELMSIKPEGGGKSREVQTNTAKFLALTLPASHNIGVIVDDPDTPTPHPPITPVFATQYMEDGNISNRSSKSKQNTGTDANTEGNSTIRSKLSQESMASTTTATKDSQSMYSTGTNSTNLTGKSRGSRKKNFLKRNKELAGDAANAIAMTEEEKRRVDNLLINLDALPEVPEESDAGSISGAAPSDFNPFAVVLADGEGFKPETDDMLRLEDIDSRLKALMPPAEFESIASTPRSVQSRQSVLFTRTALEADGDQTWLGERALQEAREQRTFQARLREIESELNTLTSAIEHEMDSPRLTATQLQGLLDQCALTMQRATNETDALAESQHGDLSESRAALLAAPPHLEEDVLQKLLADARAEMHCSSSQFTADSSTDGDIHGIQLGPLSEDNIRELLQDSRSTSRNMSRASGTTSEDEYSTAIPDKSNWPMHTVPHHPDTLHSPSTGDHTYKAQPHINGYPPQPPFGSSPQAIIGDNLHVASLDEEEMMAVMVSNGLGGDNVIDRRPFLPDIDPKGSLTTQRPSNSMYTMPVGEGMGKDSGLRSAGMNTYNSVSDHGGYTKRDDESTPTPHPPNSSRPSSSRPSSSRPSSGSAGKPRSITLRTCMD